MEEIESGKISCQALPRITVMLLEDGETYCSLNNRRLYVLKWAREKGLLPGNTIGVRVKEQTQGTSKVASKYSLERCSDTAKFIAGHRKDPELEGAGGSSGGGEGSGPAKEANAGGKGTQKVDPARPAKDGDSDDDEQQQEEERASKSKRHGKRKDRKSNYNPYVYAATTNASEITSKPETSDQGGEAADGASKGEAGTNSKAPAVRSGTDGVRVKYAAHGSATAYYEEEGGVYTNPHDGAIKAILTQSVALSPEMWTGKVLDLACGSGEATEALVEAGVPYTNIDACDPYTLDAYYARCSSLAAASNGSSASFAKDQGSSTAAVSGDETAAAAAAGGAATLTPGDCAGAVTGKSLREVDEAGGATLSSVCIVPDELGAGAGASAAGDDSSGNQLNEELDEFVKLSVLVPRNSSDSSRSSDVSSDQVFPWSFEDIAAGVLDGRHYTTVVCSFALHLCKQSYLATTCSALAMAADYMIVLTPHKRPEIKPAWGWKLVSDERDDHWRVRSRLYSSTFSSYE